MPIQISVTRVTDSIYRLVVQDHKIILRTFEGSYSEILQKIYAELSIMEIRQ